MGDSLHSIGQWIGLITFIGAVIAVANTLIQSPVVWLCLGLWLVIVVLYLLVKLIRARVNVRSRRTGTHKKEQEQLLHLRGKEQYLKNPMVEGSISQEFQTSKSKDAGFKLPPLAGFSPQGLQRPTSKKLPQGPSPSPDYVPPGLPPELFLK